MQRYKVSGGPNFNSDSTDTEENETETKQVNATAILGKVRELKKLKEKKPKPPDREIIEVCSLCMRGEKHCAGEKYAGKWTEGWRRSYVKKFYSIPKDPNDPDGDYQIAEQFQIKDEYGNEYTVTESEDNYYDVDQCIWLDKNGYTRIDP